MRTVYLGTSAFSAAVLERLAASPHRPELVVTRPDRPRGRGRRLAPPPVAERARSLGIDVEQPEGVNHGLAVARIAAAAPDVLCLCAYGAIIREPLLGRWEMFNAHPSLLPRWRGAAPIERAIMAGDSETGVSIMRVSAGLDAGPVCLTATEPILADDTYGSLAARLQRLAGDLLVRALDERPPWREQDGAGVTYAERISPQDRLLDPARPADELERIVRALDPHIGARLELPDGAVLGVQAVALVDTGPRPGELRVDGGRLVLGCAQGALELRRVQPPGGRPMDGASWERGRRPGALS